MKQTTQEELAELEKAVRELLEALLVIPLNNLIKKILIALKGDKDVDS